MAGLFEDEGICRHLLHGDGSHKLVMVDGASMREPIQGNPALPYYGGTALVPSDTECLSG